jgi:NAD(P)-dependent dehydrogenase (short-subunit alcohol dehydrogenase family)
MQIRIYMNNNHSLSIIKTIRWAAAGVGVMLVANALYKELSKFNLSGKVVLITGGSRGLGLVLARALAMRGAKLALCARSADKLEIARQELEEMGAEVITLPVDVTDQDQVKTMIGDVIRKFGSLDVLINNAGIIQVGPQDSMSIEDYEKAMQTNFWAPLYAIHAALPYFRRQGGGKIVNITSIGGKIAVPHLLPYSASKFAAVGLSEGMHAELKRENIQVVTVVPNLMRTGSVRNITVKGDHEAEYAWFKGAGSSPLLSQEAEVAARNIIKAIEYGESEAALSLSGKLAAVVKGIAPGWVNIALGLANTFLPEPLPGRTEEKKGYEVESESSQRTEGNLSDKAAVKNNEM